MKQVAMDPTRRFFKRSLQIAAEFLQTAVVIDDRAFRDEATLPEVTPGPLVAPDSLETVDISSLPSLSEPATDFEPVDPNPHGIDARAVIDSFAELGIVCSVLRRESGEDLTNLGDRAHKLSVAVDISVVDWQVHRPDGSDSHEETLEFVKTAVEESIRSQPEQLRLIIIYTGTLDLLSVAAEIEKCLQSAAGFEPQKDGDFAFRVHAIRVVILGKPSNKRPADLQSHQIQSETELANRAVQEFAMMTTGLISNLAVASLAEIRKTTHRLLSRFGQKLDAPFLTHRALLTPPSEGNDQLLPLIVSELEAILEDRVSQDLLSDDAIIDWLETRPDPLALIDLAPKIKTEEAARETVKDLCLKGVGQYSQFAIPNEPSWVKKLANDKDASSIDKLTNVIAAEVVDGSNEAFELLMSIRSHYSEKPPMLTLGTLVSSYELGERNSASAYWLCLQPACDSYIRSGSSRRLFPLLQLKTTDNQFNLIVEDQTRVIRLRWEPKPYKMRMIEFEANSPSGSVLSKAENKTFWFAPTINSIKYRWVGQLKFPQAQRVANAVASEAARIGLTESEWLRRSGK
jgi:hypothetical protein